MNQDEFDKLLKDIRYEMAKRSGMTSGMWNTGGISPTDVDAKGMYPYQEPEVDEQGTYYGYKILHINPFHPDQFVSPRYQKYWNDDGELEADHEPGKNHMHGIHCTKRPDHPELRKYISVYSSKWIEHLEMSPWYLVKCALSGTIVETEQGFRAQHAQIIGVLFDGYWRSYQDHKERAQANSRPTPEPWQEDQTGEGWSYRTASKGYWRTPYDPNP